MYTFVLLSGGEESERAARSADLHRLLTATQGQSVAVSGKLSARLKGQSHQIGLNRGSGQFLNFSCSNDFLAKSVFLPVSHQWCDLFYRPLHSYTRHIERVARGERDTVLSA